MMSVIQNVGRNILARQRVERNCERAQMHFFPRLNKLVTVPTYCNNFTCCNALKQALER
jgi:hypothetical protein